MSDREDDLLRSRRDKLVRLRERGIDPFPPRYDRTSTISDAAGSFKKMESEQETVQSQESVSIAGRIITIRAMGKAAFLDVRDESAKIQVYLRRDNLGDDYELMDYIDMGDFIGVTGTLFRTRSGEITVEARQLTFLSKSLRPLPDKWHGLKDTEHRYRQRYLDLIANPSIRDVFLQRSKIISAIRSFMGNRGFIEVDTPVLVPIAAGALARPFTTHHHTLNEDLYMRIAIELYLKRLIVGGFDRVYEIGRVFRNEGIDQDHNPEFTLMESYEAYADYNVVMQMVEDLVSWVASEVLGGHLVHYGDHMIDLSPPWEKLDLAETIYNRSGVHIDQYRDSKQLAQKMRGLGIEVKPLDSWPRMVDKLISVTVEPHLIQPTFLLDYPSEMSPLAKPSPHNPGQVERFEAFAAGMEIANSFTELNDPDLQRERFEEQDQMRLLYKDEEVDRLDDDFLTALEHGMPPTGGLGIGIDRLVMLLTGQSTIRDVMLFPQMRSSR